MNVRVECRFQDAVGLERDVKIARKMHFLEEFRITSKSIQLNKTAFYNIMKQLHVLSKF